MTDIKDQYTCLFCTIGHHKSVECGGIYYCPNPLCTGSGGAWFRTKLRSYKATSDTRHTVDWEEWAIYGREYLNSSPEADPQIWAAFEVEEIKVLKAAAEERCRKIGRRINVVEDDV